MIQPLPILCKAATAVESGDGPLDDSALGQHGISACVGALDDHDVDLPADPREPALEFQSLVAATGIEHE